MYLVKDNLLECYGWSAGERLIVLRDLTEKFDLPEKFFLVWNIDLNEKAGVLESQMDGLEVLSNLD